MSRYLILFLEINPVWRLILFLETRSGRLGHLEPVRGLRELHGIAFADKIKRRRAGGVHGLAHIGARWLDATTPS